MQKFKNWLISALLRKDRLVAVPQDWQTEYVKLAGDKVRNKGTITTLINEYNQLLKDYFEKCSVKEIQEELKDTGVQVKSTMTKAELAELAYQEFRMTIERD